MVTKENDRYEWMRETAQHLRNDELDQIDPEATADWFDEVRRSDRHEVVSRLRLIIEHRLKLDYVTGPEFARKQARRDSGSANRLANSLTSSTKARAFVIF